MLRDAHPPEAEELAGIEKVLPIHRLSRISSRPNCWNPLKVQERRAELAAALAPCTVCSLIFDEATAT